jgi:hypothetical protein
MDERVKADLESGDGAVLVEEEVARGGNAVAGLGLVRARLPCSKILQGLRGIENVVGVNIADDGADFRVCRDGAAGRAGK